MITTIDNILKIVQMNPTLIPTSGENSIYTIDGSSSPKVRSFLNLLIKLTKQPKYLEIGTHKGSTLISALFNNEARAVAIDNYCESSMEIKNLFIENTQKYFQELSKCEISLYFEDCFTVDPLKIPYLPFNIYFYDGAHDEKSQHDAISYYISAMDKEFVLIVDDWNDPRAQAGTQAAIKDLNLVVKKEWELFCTMGTTGGNVEDWWNGLYIAVVKK